MGTGQGLSMDRHQALTLAIFALNTYLNPEASSPADLAILDKHAESVIETLAAMREEVADDEQH